MKKYILTKNFEDGLKKGMVFQWDRVEGCYTTNNKSLMLRPFSIKASRELPWMLTPLIPRTQLNKMIKDGSMKVK